MLSAEGRARGVEGDLAVVGPAAAGGARRTTPEDAVAATECGGGPAAAEAETAQHALRRRGGGRGRVDADIVRCPGAGAKPARISRTHGGDDLSLAAASSCVRKATALLHVTVHD